MKPLIAVVACVLTLGQSLMAAVTSREIAYEHNGVKLKGYFAVDEDAAKKAGGKVPGVLVVPEWWGHNDYARKRADMFAALGYAAFALDMYGEGVLAKDGKEAGALAGPFYGPDPETGVRTAMRERAAAGLAVLAKQPEVDAKRLASVGYCMGGTVSLELARAGADLTAVISYHGGLNTPKPESSQIKAKVLICHGADDPMVPDDEVAAFKAEMVQHKVDYVFVAFGGAVHAFTNPAAGTGASAGIPGVKYNEAADKRSWAMTKEFLAEAMK